MKAYLNLRENNKLEAKEAIKGFPKSTWETYSAFANTDGGIILLGVGEDKNQDLYVKENVNVKKLEIDLWNVLNDSRKVSKNILRQEDVKKRVHNGLEYLEIIVPRASSENRPIYLNNNIFEVYKRNHTGDYKCSKEEIISMLRDQTKTFDSEPLLDFSINDLSNESIRIYRNIYDDFKGNHIWKEKTNVEFLEKIRAIKNVNGKYHPTRAGLLFFGFDYKILNVYPNYFLDYREKIGADIRYSDRINSGTDDWSGNIFDFYNRVVAKLLLDLPVPFMLDKDNIHRKMETDIHVAVREALVNCLANADYTLPRGLVIIKKIDEITFENPGLLKVGIEQALKGGISDPRNLTIFHFFNQIGLGERAGSGIPTIVDSFEKAGYTKPELREEFNPDRTFLKLFLTKKIKYNETVESDSKVEIDYKELTNQEKIIVDYLKENNEITRIYAEELLGVKTRRANEILKELVDKEIIIKLGEHKNIRYSLKR
ncbi:MAG: AAA family ATPase [Acholeplasmataceae bacterium]|nr:AAA family ATPase [Acholeplasmataceae bacterium]